MSIAKGADDNDIVMLRGRAAFDPLADSAPFVPASAPDRPSIQLVDTCLKATRPIKSETMTALIKGELKGDLLADFQDAWGVFLQPKMGGPVTAAGGDSGSFGRMAGTPWEAPAPLFEFRPPAFPVDALPTALRRFVSEVAIATQTPPDLGAMLALTVVAASCAKRVVVEPWVGYREPINLYGVVALPPGSRKSAVFSEMQAPLTEYEQAEVKRVGPLITAAESRVRILELEKSALETKAAKASDHNEKRRLEDEAKRKGEEIKGYLKAGSAEALVLASPLMAVSDVTPESLASLLHEQGGRIAVLSAEGGLFDIIAGRYSTGSPNLEVFLKGHSGDELRVNRIKRAPEYVRAPALTIGLAVQPDVIQSLADKPAIRGRGLLARFLYSMPESNLGRREIAPPPASTEGRTGYCLTILSLLQLPPTEIEHSLTLSPEALELFVGLARSIEPRLGERGDLSAITDWAAKFPGAVARIAGCIHMARLASDTAPWRKPIDGRTMAAAIQIGEYLILHAQAAFSVMQTDAATANAKTILHWLEQEYEVTAFTHRQLQQAVKHKIDNVEALERALAIVVARGYVREALAKADEAHAKKSGRKPKPSYEVNPMWTRGRAAASPPT